MTTLVSQSIVLDRWLAACEANPLMPLQTSNTAPYRYIWNAWIKSLNQTPWNQANSVQLVNFINSAAPEKDNPSEITRRRYWRVLDRVYDFALLHGLCQHNPAQDLASCDMPDTEEYISAVLSPRLWATYLKHIPSPNSLLAARDNAFLRVLYETGARQSEIQRLTTSDVITLQNNPAMLLTKRDGSQRAVVISHDTENAIQNYISKRHAQEGNILFMSRFRSVLEDRAISHITQTHLSYVAAIEKLPKPPRKGSQIVRNSRLLYWLLEGVPILEVMERAGLKSINSLASLRPYLPDHIRLIISSSAENA